MLNFPPELMDSILSSLEPEDLCTLMHTSSNIRQRAVTQLLSQYGVGTPQITSGTISLPHRACFLVPIIYAMHPIQKLQITCNWQRPLGVISDIVATVPQIPDVLLRGIQKEEADVVTKLIATLSRDGKDLVIIAGRRTLAISRPRHGRTPSPGSQFRPFGHEYHSLHLVHRPHPPCLPGCWRYRRLHSHRLALPPSIQTTVGSGSPHCGRPRLNVGQDDAHLKGGPFWYQQSVHSGHIL
ncbi:hypothetical protein B0H16DRAFT_1526526 [Mycena metata]|uniref:F-box domain-containing protein n=1 Tax=Mycena metata TaxID=1033252 RepID=A0AAD7NJ81_9AGAR|nr:hypothetical protein B0H16DRAFT_1526526 [Mycena metata]